MPISWFFLVKHIDVLSFSSLPDLRDSMLFGSQDTFARSGLLTLGDQLVWAQAGGLPEEKDVQNSDYSIYIYSLEPGGVGSHVFETCLVHLLCFSRFFG